MLINGSKDHKIDLEVKDGKLIITADLKPMTDEYLSSTRKSFNLVCSGGRKEIVLQVGPEAHDTVVGTLNLCVGTKNPQAYA